MMLLFQTSVLYPPLVVYCPVNSILYPGLCRIKCTQCHNLTNGLAVLVLEMPLNFSLADKLLDILEKF